eukprot:m.140734 g.140734  ORF g.140734 m.140734 type:complete len:410 (-) comp14833_c0_seq2:1606-2835(-)
MDLESESDRPVRLVLGENDRLLKPQNRVGIDNLPDQVVRSITNKGFVFNVMICGQSGIGKTTLVNSLMKTDILSKRSPQTHVDGVSIRSCSTPLVEGSVRVELNINCSVGIADQQDREHSAKPLQEFLESQFDARIENELNTIRDANVKDSRVHVCIYLIPPSGRYAKALDLSIMKALSQKVNLIPVIAKADTITPTELREFKKSIMKSLSENDIRLFTPKTKKESFMANLPFAVIASDHVISVAGEKIRARQYPWGLVDVENKQYSDLPLLRDVLFRQHTYDLIRSTDDVYQLYREIKLSKLGFADSDKSGNPIRLLDTYEAKKQQHLVDLERRESEMRQNFVKKVSEKESEMENAKKELESKYTKLKVIHEREEQHIQSQMEQLETEIKEWELQKTSKTSRQSTRKK